MKKIKMEMEVLQCRIETQFINFFKNYSEKTKLNFSFLIRLGLYSFIKQLYEENKENKNLFVINNINIADFAELKQLKVLRETQSFFRNEEKSKHLFLRRVGKDLMLYCINKQNKNKMKELFNLYKKEAKLYQNNEELLKEMCIFEKLIEEKPISEVKNLVLLHFENIIELTIEEKEELNKTRQIEIKPKKNKNDK